MTWTNHNDSYRSDRRKLNLIHYRFCKIKNIADHKSNLLDKMPRQEETTFSQNLG